jgi:hypothetical protein
MSVEPQHDLFSFIRGATEEMAREYRRIYAHASKDPGTAGDQGEENWKKLLQDWLPPYYRIVTKGKILSATGELSPQIDVLVLDPSYPQALGNNKYYLDAGVVAAFECKTTLTAAHIKQAVENAAKIRTGLDNRQGSPYHELHSPLVYGLLAHSHSWKGERSKPLEVIERHLRDQDMLHIHHPRESLDILCVADLATWTLARHSDLVLANVPAVEPDLRKYAMGDVVPITATTYIGRSSTENNRARDFHPIGALLSNLILRLAWESEDRGLRKLAWYFSKVNLEGEGGGRGRSWAGQTVFSPAVFQRLLQRPTRPPQALTVFWDYWSYAWF